VRRLKGVPAAVADCPLRASCIRRANRSRRWWRRWRRSLVNFLMSKRATELTVHDLAFALGCAAISLGGTLARVRLDRGDSARRLRTSPRPAISYSFLLQHRQRRASTAVLVTIMKRSAYDHVRPRTSHSLSCVSLVWGGGRPVYSNTPAQLPLPCDSRRGRYWQPSTVLACGSITMRPC